MSDYNYRELQTYTRLALKRALRVTGVCAAIIVAAFPLGIALDAMFSVSPPRSKINYSGSVGLSLIGEGSEQRISAQPNDDPAGYVFFVCREELVDMSPIFQTKLREIRFLHVSLFLPSEQELRGAQADPWRAMLSEYFKANAYDTAFFEKVLLPDVDQEHTIWIAVWMNGFIVMAILYVIWRISYPLVVSRIRLNRENKGCCRMCGYDLRGKLSTGCPECGWGRALRAKTMSSTNN